MSGTKMLGLYTNLSHGDIRRPVMNSDEVLAFLNDHRETMIAIGSAIVAMFSAFLARRETVKQRKLMEETLRQRLDGGSIKWGDEAIEALALAEGLSHPETHDDIKADRIIIAQRLSALADRGRLFFPNHEEASKGGRKETAFRGSRPPILDALVFAHMELISLGKDDEVNADFLRRCRRLVVSEMQDHLDPRHWDSVIERGSTTKHDQRTDSQRRASVLQAELMSRRIEYFKENEKP